VSRSIAPMGPRRATKCFSSQRANVEKMGAEYASRYVGADHRAEHRAYAK